MADKPEGQIGGQPILFLFKSMKQEHVDGSMKKGRFRFSHPSVFSGWEDKDSAQCDKWEGHGAHGLKHLYVAPYTKGETQPPPMDKWTKIADETTVHFESDAAKHTPICCFRAIRSDDLLSDKERRNAYFPLHEIADRIRNEFNHDAYILVEATPFLERMRKSVPCCYTGAVIYQDTMNEPPFSLDKGHQIIAEQIFRKDEKFAWQKEYRIALAPAEKSPVFVEIGSIEDIACCGSLIDCDYAIRIDLNR
jgi:hypothetical protein